MKTRLTIFDATGHLTDEALDEFYFERLPEPLLDPFEKHLLWCKQCQDRCRDNDGFIDTLRDLDPPRSQTPPRHGFFRGVNSPRVWAPLAAAAAVAAVLLAPVDRPAGAAAITLHAMRGLEAAVTAPAGRTLDLRLAVPAPFESAIVEIADTAGASVLRQPIRIEDGHARVQFPGLAPGRYWVRLYENTTLRQEYGLRVSP
jgi:hypothetical protein